MAYTGITLQTRAICKVILLRSRTPQHVPASSVSDGVRNPDFRDKRGAWSPVQWTSHALPVSNLRRVGVDLRRLHIRMPDQLSNGLTRFGTMGEGRANWNPFASSRLRVMYQLLIPLINTATV